MISVIIPIYNAEKYIKKCINSIIKQDYQNLEIILLIDGSKDKSLQICKKMSLNDHRIKIIYKKQNEGIEKARIDGINFAKGNYIFFIDSDDWLNNNHVLSLLRTKITEDIDYVQIGVKKVLDRHGFINIKWNKYPDRVLNRKEIEISLIETFVGKFLIDVNCWGKLYRADFLKNANLKPLGFIYQEDLMFHLQLYSKLNKILILQKVGYCYRWGGMTKRYTPLKYYNLKEQYLYRRKLFNNINKNSYIHELNLWMINAFKNEVKDRINHSFFKIKKDDIIKFIEQELYSFPLNLVLNELENSEKKEILKNFIHRQYNIIYNQCFDDLLNHIIKIRISMIVKKMVSFI